MLLKRTELAGIIVEAAKEMDAVLALWENGSASFNRTDEFSDVDLAAMVKTGHVEPVAAAIRSALSRVAPIAQEYRQLTYHGNAQFIWQLEGMSRMALT